MNSCIIFLSIQSSGKLTSSPGLTYTSTLARYLVHSESFSLYLSQEQTLWGASPGLLQYNVRSPCKWYSIFNWLSLPVSQRSLSACSPLTLVLAQWFWPSWLPSAVSCEICFVKIDKMEKLSFAFPLRVKQQASVLFSKNYENSVMLLLFHWFFLLKDELKWSHFRQFQLKENFDLTFARKAGFYLSVVSPKLPYLLHEIF